MQKNLKYCAENIEYTAGKCFKYGAENNMNNLQKKSEIWCRKKLKYSAEKSGI